MSQIGCRVRVEEVDNPTNIILSSSTSCKSPANSWNDWAGDKNTKMERRMKTSHVLILTVWRRKCTWKDFFKKQHTYSKTISFCRFMMIIFPDIFYTHTRSVVCHEALKMEVCVFPKHFVSYFTTFNLWGITKRLPKMFLFTEVK